MNAELGFTREWHDGEEDTIEWIVEYSQTSDIIQDCSPSLAVEMYNTDLQRTFSVILDHNYEPLLDNGTFL